MDDVTNSGKQMVLRGVGSLMMRVCLSHPMLMLRCCPCLTPTLTKARPCLTYPFKSTPLPHTYPYKSCPCLTYPHKRTPLAHPFLDPLITASTQACHRLTAIRVSQSSPPPPALWQHTPSMSGSMSHCHNSGMPQALTSLPHTCLIAM